MYKLWIFIIFICTSFGILAKSKHYQQIQPRPSYVDDFHSSLSKNVLSLSESFDGFFADETHEKLPNKSKLKLTFESFLRESAGPYAKPKFNYQLVLPNTQKKFQLVVSTDFGDKQDTTSDAAKSVKPNTDPSVIEQTAAGVRYVLNASGVQFYSTTGIIVSVPTKVFSKINFKKNIPFKYGVQKIYEQIKWVSSDGLSSDFNWDFDTRLNNKLLLRFVNNLYWNDYSNNYAFTLTNGPSLFYDLGNNRRVSFHAHATSTDSPVIELIDYTLLASYRRLIYKKWLFLEVAPFVNFPKENGFKRVPGMMIKLESIFGYLK